MSKRFINSILSRQIDGQQLQKIETGLKRLQETVRFEDQPCIHGTCYCLICNENVQLKLKQQNSQGDNKAEDCDKWLLKIFNGLFLSHTPSLILFISDSCFVDGNLLQIFHTDPKNNRIKKLQGIHPIRTLYPAMIRLRKKYKWMLGQNYKKKFIQTLDPNFMHEKYLDNMIPTVMDKVAMMEKKKEKKSQNIIIHKNEKLVDQNIEEHKLQQKQSFCTVKFKTGASQIFTKAEFQRWTDMRNKGMLKTAEISLVQSFIKQKQQTEAFFISSLTLNEEGYGINADFDDQLFEKAENQILVLLGGISKYSNSYQDIENFEDFTEKLMESDPKKYIRLMTYKIVHYLGMVSRIYVKNIKINWILNDIDQIYLQNIQEFQTVQLALKPLKYRLPPKEKDSSFYKDSENFMKIYNQIQANNDMKRRRIRQSFLQIGEESFQMPSINYPSLSTTKSRNITKTKSVAKPNLRQKSVITINSARNPSPLFNPKPKKESIQNKWKNNTFVTKRRIFSESKKFQL